MTVRLNKTTAILAVVTLVYVLLFLYLPMRTTCDVVQSQQWNDDFYLQFYAATFLVIIVSLVLRATKKISNRELLLHIFVVVVFLVFVNSFYVQDTRIAECSGTVLSDNWWSALNWIKNNTAECSVVATYWDPGHFITGIAKRHVVFDGATQGAQITVPTDSTENGIVIEKYDNGINHILLYKNSTVTRARIQDISTTLLTGNETLAVRILKDYELPNCTEMYYIASADLIGKSTWWSYFATWNPLNTPNFGHMYNYAVVSLENAKPINENAIAYTYRLAQNAAFVLIEANNTIKPYLQQQNQFVDVEKMAYFDNNGVTQTYINPTAQVKGLLWVDPSRQTIVFIPPELETSLFTRMFFFNGAGLNNFEFVNNWGGEVKLFRVKLN